MRVKYQFMFVLAVLMAFGSTALFGQEKSDKPGEYLVSLYQVAPGKHLEFLKWMAAQEAIAKEAGAPPAQWYAHLNGDSWDYIVINKQLDHEEEAKVDRKTEELAKKKGHPTGMAASVKFRQFMNSHTDTYVMGPYTAQEMVEAIEK